MTKLQSLSQNDKQVLCKTGLKSECISHSIHFPETSVKLSLVPFNLVQYANRKFGFYYNTLFSYNFKGFEWRLQSSDVSISSSSKCAFRQKQGDSTSHIIQSEKLGCDFECMQLCNQFEDHCLTVSVAGPSQRIKL